MPSGFAATHEKQLVTRAAPQRGLIEASAWMSTEVQHSLTKQRADAKRRGRTATPKLYYIPNGPAERAQLRQIAASTLWGVDDPASTLVPGLYTLISGLYGRSSPAFDYALDALSLAHAGSRVQNPQALQQGQRSYYRAVQRLRMELQLALDQDRYSNQTLAAPYLLFLCDRYAQLETTVPADLDHLKGCAHVLAARASHYQPAESQIVLHTIYHHHAFEYGITARKGIVIVPDHPSLLVDNPMNRVPRMFNQAMAHAPAALEQCDTILASLSGKTGEQYGSARVAAKSHLGRLDELLALLHNLLQAFHDGGPDIFFWTTPSTSLATFDAELDILSMEAFGTGFMFKSVHGAATPSLGAWISSFLLQAAALELRLAASEPVPRFKKGVRSVTQQADNVCRTIMFFCATPENGKLMVDAVGVVLSLLWPWYVAIGDRTKVAWCEAASRFVERRGFSCQPSSLVQASLKHVAKAAALP